MNSKRRHYLVPTSVFLAVWTIYVFSSSSAIGWLDSPEFGAAAFSLGVPHSPGHPLPTFLGKLVSFVPFGEIAWRINLASALAAAGAAVFLWSCGLILLSKAAAVQQPSMKNSLLSALFAFMVALSSAYWSNAIRAEVYALQAFLLLACLNSVLRWHASSQAKHLLLSCFYMGLALSNHHWMALMFFAPATLFFFIRRHKRPSLRACLYGAIVGCAGLSVLAYLPIRSLTHPVINFGAPHTFERFFWTLSGAAFAKSAQIPHNSPFGFDLIQTLIAVCEAITWPMALVSLVSLTLGIMRKSHRGPLLLLFATVVTTCAGRALLGFDPETPDHHAYLMPAVASMALLALWGVGVCIDSLEKSWLKDASVLALSLVTIFALLHGRSQYRNNSNRGLHASTQVAEWELTELPPRSLVLLSYFQTRFRQWAMSTYYGARPDVALLDRSFLSYPGYAAEELRRHPELANIINAPLRAGYPTPLRELREHQGPLFMQLHQNVDQEAMAELIPQGPYARMFSHTSEKATSKAVDMKASSALNMILSDPKPSEVSAFRTTKLWHDTTRLNLLCFLRQRSWAQSIYEDVKQIAPDDPMLLSMGQHCGLEPFATKSRQ